MNTAHGRITKLFLQSPIQTCTRVPPRKIHRAASERACGTSQVVSSFSNLAPAKRYRSTPLLDRSAARCRVAAYRVSRVGAHLPRQQPCRSCWAGQGVHRPIKELNGMDFAWSDQQRELLDAV